MGDTSSERFMRVVLVGEAGRVVAVGDVDVGDGYDGCPVIMHAGKVYTPTGRSDVLRGGAIYLKREEREIKRYVDPATTVAQETPKEDRDHECG